MPAFGIDMLSVFALPPLEFVALAADLGRPTISLGLEPFGINPEGYPGWSLRTDAALRRAVRAALQERGVALALGEGFVLLPGMTVRDAFERDLALMAELGAAQICVVSFDPDRTRTLDGYAETAALAAAAGLATVVEFAPCFAATATLADAVAARDHVARPDFRILVDTMHLARSGGTAADLAALPADTVGYVQLCDVPRTPSTPDYLVEAMRERRPPGEGDLPLHDFVSALPADVPFSLEIPLAAEAEAGAGPATRMDRAVSRTIALMSGVDGAPR